MHTATLLRATCAGIAVLLAGCSTRPSAADLHTRETAAIARDFMHIQYEQKNLTGAKAKYYTPDFIQHNPEIASGVHGDKTFIDARGANNPAQYRPIEEWTNIVDHVLVQDKLFAIHHRLYTNPNDTGRVFMDIWRVENGKMVEHWDIIQPIPASALNDNTMWSDLAPGDPATGNTVESEAVVRDYLRIGLELNDPKAAAEKYIADNFRQHSPHIADGKAALLEYFGRRMVDPAFPPRQNYVSHIIADRDLVLVTRHSTRGGEDRGSMYGDLFRIQRGKIIEHWDVIQAVPEKSVNGNTMW